MRFQHPGPRSKPKSRHKSPVCASDFAILLRRYRVRYKGPNSELFLAHLSHCMCAKSTMPCPCERRIVREHLEYQRRTLGLLVTTIILLARPLLKSRKSKYPSSKCLHRFNASCAFVLHAVHSNLNTTFFVVLAFLWNTGFV
jgi:hypothetical protein